jgi:hypothetical protein
MPKFGTHRSGGTLALVASSEIWQGGTFELFSILSPVAFSGPFEVVATTRPFFRNTSSPHQPEDASVLGKI